MHDNDVAESAVAATRQEWFWMLVSYMKMRTLAVWLCHYPNSCCEEFDLIWPTLFEQMLAHATSYAIERLAQLNAVNRN
jgi:hypothetical protein